MILFVRNKYPPLKIRPFKYYMPLKFPTLLTVMEFNPVTLIVFPPTVILLSYIINYIADPHGVKSIPGPLLAKFTDAWLAWVSKEGHRSEVVHQLHKEFGTYLPLFSHLTFTHFSFSKEPSSVSPLTTSPSPIPKRSKPSTRTETVPKNQISTMLSSLSNVASSTRVIGPIMLGSARLSPISFRKRACWSLSRT